MDNNENPGLPDPPKITEDSIIRGNDTAQMRSQAARRNEAKLAQVKADIKERLEGLGDTEPVKKKGSKKLVIGLVAGAAAIALATFGITAATSASRVAAYDAAVDGHNKALTATAAAEADTVTALADFERASKTHTDDFVAQIKVAAIAPTELISEKTNKPIVELYKQLEDSAATSSEPTNQKTLDLAKPAAPLASSDRVQVTPELVTEVEGRRADADARLKKVDAALKAATKQSTDLDKAVLAGAETISVPAAEALKNKDAFAKTAPKADAKDFNAKADALKKSTDAYTKAEKSSVEQAAALVKTESEFVASATALKVAHDKTVADEAAAAAAAAAEAAANAYVEPQWDGGGYVEPEWNGGGGGSNPPPSNNGGGGWNPPPSNGGGGGGGTPHFNPGDFTADPCEAAGTCLNNNI